ncbi:MAG: NADH-quinone oxidoreductase subunit C [Terrimicrobiaceae bacterium]|nr:NADH-quinone oxidoreductase subunit C [Terrimicrobiaceae bacterium]
MTAAAAAEKIRSRFADAVHDESDFRGEKSLTIDLASLRAVCEFAKSELGFDYLIDISSVDHFGDEPRFEMVYELYALEPGTHLRIKAKVSEDEPTVPTVSDLWPTADWHEREVFDMMGIRFSGHPDLRRILMWDGFPYFPLRKDFPLQGKPSDVPDVAFTDVAPLAGGPFVTVPTDGTTQVREPRARHAPQVPPSEKFLPEP